MTLKTRNRYFLVSLVSVFVMAVTILFSGGKISFLPLLVRGSSSEPINGSITWNKDSNKTKLNNNFKEYSFYTSTGRGTGIYVYSYGNYEPTKNNIFDSGNDNSDYGIYIVSEMGNKNALFTFQQITAVTLVTGSWASESSLNGFKFYPNGLSEPYTTSDVKINKSTTYRFTTEVANGTKLVIMPKSSLEIDITSLTIEYTCTPGAAPTPVEKTLSSISLSGQTTAFTVGDTFSFGGTVTAHYSDSTTADVTSSSTFSGYDMSESGNQTVTVSYTESGVIKTTTYSISVSETPEGITLSGTYNFASRTSYSTPVWSNKMWIVFTSDTAGYWRSTRSGFVDGVKYNFDCKVYFDYEVEESSGSYSVSMSMTSYEFRRFRDDTGEEDTVTTPGASWFSGYSYDRPVDNDFTAASAYNNTGVVTSDKATLTISVFERKTNPVRYVVYDTFTFALAS